MKLTVNIKEVESYLTKSNVPASDYAINPYVGCPHGCKYCYACFMNRFTGHTEEWGSFVDVKISKKPIAVKKLVNKSVSMATVTDCYNPAEKQYKITRNILEQLVDVPCHLNIITRSSLVLRDIDLLKRCKNVEVAISINTLDEQFKRDMDHADSIKNRIRTLKELHENGIYTILFMSPIFPEITNFREIIEQTRDFVNEYWFENLNLRGSFKAKILSYIGQNYPDLKDLYDDIYSDRRSNKSYWDALSINIEDYCSKNNIRHTNYFYHAELVASKKTSDTVRKYSQHRIFP
ncbi:MAG: radical SAM protein [Bacteroidales bacterium]|jgi:DNA repair photolyase|nr:radical SAM protein [Bacteroidales bacterium]